MNSSVKIWGATVAIAAVLIAVPLFLGRAPQKSAEVALQETVPQLAATTAGEDKPAETKEAQAPMQGRLAGTLKLSMPGPEAERGRLAIDYSCYRINVSPPLNWSGAPRGTKSYAVFMGQKKEAGPPYLYWVRFNIPASADGIPQGARGETALSDGSLYGLNDHGVAGYAGPCDPRGTFTYVIRVFALDTVLDVPNGASKDVVSKAMRGHILDVTEMSLVHYKNL